MPDLEKERTGEVLEKEAVEGGYADISAQKAFLVFILSGVAVIALGIWLASIGDRLAATTGLSRSFVGNLFLALTTSLPEIAASLAAIRLGAIDLAIGNVLGSNLFNITLFFVYDLADGSANFWASLDQCECFCRRDDHHDDWSGHHQPDVSRLAEDALPHFLGWSCHCGNVCWFDGATLFARLRATANESGVRMNTKSKKKDFQEGSGSHCATVATSHPQ